MSYDKNTPTIGEENPCIIKVETETPTGLNPVKNAVSDLSVSNKHELEGDSLEERAMRKKAFSRRALLQAGWAIPVILATELPTTVYAQQHGNPVPSTASST